MYNLLVIDGKQEKYLVKLEPIKGYTRQSVPKQANYSHFPEKNSNKLEAGYIEENTQAHLGDECSFYLARRICHLKRKFT